MKALFKVLLIANLFFLSPIVFCETYQSQTEITPGSPFFKYLDADLFKRELYIYARVMDQKMGVKSNEAYSVPLGKIGILKPVDMSAGEKFPTAGAWFHRYKITRGGETRTYNLCFMAQGEGAPKKLAMVMGTSEAGPVLQKDAMPAVLTAAYQRNKDKWAFDDYKKLVVIKDTGVVEPTHTLESHGETLEGVWTEKWIVQVQNTEIPMFISFIPDKQGGTTYMVLGEDETRERIAQGQ